MSRLVLPFPILGLLSIAFLVVLGVQALVYMATANFLAKEVWAGECTPQKLQGKRIVELLMLCDGEEVTTKRPAIILAWINNQQPARCSKEADWHSGDVSWDCSTNLATTDNETSP